MRKHALAGALAALVLLSTMGPALAAAATSINYGAGPNQGVRVHEDEVTIDKHDRVEMSGALAYYGDDGEVSTLPAVINDSEEAPVRVNLAKVNESQYREFPRQSREDGNNITWTDSAEWSTSSSASGGMTVSSTTPAEDAQAVTFDITAGSSEHGQANYTNVSITSDATKRVPLVGVNVDSLSTDAVVDIRFVDSDGDYVAMEVNETGLANDSDIIANETGEAFVSQERLSELTVEGSGDGSLDSIEEVEVYGSGANSKIELFALDAESKSSKDVAKAYHDHDGDGNMEWETLQDKTYPGEVNMTSLSDLGPMFDTAIVYDKKVANIFYTGETADVETSFNFVDAEDYPDFPSYLNASYRIEVPAPIDVSHGTLTLEAKQSVPEERFLTFEYATAVDGTEFENISYTDASSSLGSKGDVITLKSGVNAGEELAFHVEVLHTESEIDALTSEAVAGGPVGSGGGFFSTLFGKVVGIFGAVAGALGLSRLLGGS